MSDNLSYSIKHIKHAHLNGISINVFPLDKKPSYRISNSLEQGVEQLRDCQYLVLRLEKDYCVGFRLEACEIIEELITTKYSRSRKCFNIKIYANK